MKTNKYILLILALSLIHSSCTQVKEYIMNGKIANVRITKSIVLNNEKYKKVDLSLINTERSKPIIKHLLVLIPEDNHDSESFPIDTNKILEEFPIGAEINTKCTKTTSNYYVIVNTIQEHIITKWP